MRVVLDTNIIISGLLWRGTPWQVYRAAAQDKYELLISAELFSELSDALEYPKFEAKLIALGTSAESLKAEILELAEMIEDLPDIPPDAVRDTKDRIVLACAVGGKADCIVSGDNDLLVLNIFRGIPILTVEQFLARLAEK